MQNANQTGQNSDQLQDQPQNLNLNQASPNDPDTNEKKFGLSWEKDTKFEISGEELDSIIVALDKQLATPEAQSFFPLFKAAETVSGILKRSLENGLIVQK